MSSGWPVCLQPGNEFRLARVLAAREWDQAGSCVALVIGTFSVEKHRAFHGISERESSQVRISVLVYVLQGISIPLEITYL